METGDHTEHNSRDISLPMEDEDKDQTLANSIMAKLHTDSPLSAACCIFRVPEVLRRDNSKVFEPDIVAIGPFHRKKQNLEPMEDVKKWYLHTLLSRVNVSALSLIKGIKEFERGARESYQRPIDVNDKNNEFLEMMVIDGCFLIEFFRKEKGDVQQSPDDPIFNMACMQQYLYHDLLLLENQLPWNILEKLYDLTEPNDQRKGSLIDLVIKFVHTNFPVIDSYGSSIPKFEAEILHIVDLVRRVIVSSYLDNNEGPCKNDTPRVVDLVRNVIVCLRPDNGGSPHKNETLELITSKNARANLIPCVTSLLEAGIKFEKGLPYSMLNITFNEQNGTFKIPPLFFDEITEPMLRNLIAFEQCYCNCPNLITSYAVLWDRLIDTSKDAEYLRERGIIDNWLSSEDASNFFNGLYVDTFVIDFCYEKLCKRVNAYSQTKWHRWRATLVRDYFKTPWTIISLVAAFILLVLTFLQTFYSMK